MACLIYDLLLIVEVGHLSGVGLRLGYRSTVHKDISDFGRVRYRDTGMASWQLSSIRTTR